MNRKEIINLHLIRVGESKKQKFLDKITFIKNVDELLTKRFRIFLFQNKTLYFVNKEGITKTINRYSGKVKDVGAVDNRGRRFIVIYKSQNIVALQVSRIVFETFNGPIPKGSIIIHKDGNRSNNNISNLKKVDAATRCRVASFSHRKVCCEYKGVSQNPVTGRFYARLMFNGKHYSGGTYDTAEEAAIAYDNLVITLIGKDSGAYTNFSV